MSLNKTTKPASTPIRRRTIAIAFFALGMGAMVAVLSLKSNDESKSLQGQQLGSPDDVSLYKIRRLKGFQNIQPVIAIVPQQESSRMQPLKTEMMQMIDSLRQENIVTNVSVFFKEFDNGDWISINEPELYHPASLMKVPLMLSVLKAAEATPGLLTQRLVFDKASDRADFTQHFSAPTIKIGESYSVHDLLFYAAAHSDNLATNLLSSNIEVGRVTNLFENIGLVKPEMDNIDYRMNTRDYSRFMETIFNSAFLGPEYSEYAAEMLANCSFKEGFAKGLPKDVRIWHKFGEYVKPGVEAELHESATIFLDGKPFLLTVMTRGKDLDQLAKVLQLIANRVAKRTIENGYGVVSIKANAKPGC